MSHSNDAEFSNDDLVMGLKDRGWAVRADWLSATVVRQLACEARAEYADGAFAAAQVGSGASRGLAPQLRRDRIRWIEAVHATAAQAALLQRFEGLRLDINRTLMLGLFDLEAHFALYSPSAFYGRHVDRFQSDDTRTVSVVLYLNEDWNPSCGGQLRLEVEEGKSLDILPAGGTLVCFLSDRFPHEVLPASRERLSVAGWFKRRKA